MSSRRTVETHVGLRTPFCELMGIHLPIVGAGAGSIASAELAAAVTNAGGLGMTGAAGDPADAIVARIRAIRGLTNGPAGVNVILQILPPETIEAILAEGDRGAGHRLRGSGAVGRARPCRRREGLPPLRDRRRGRGRRPRRRGRRDRPGLRLRRTHGDRPDVRARPAGRRCGGRRARARRRRHRGRPRPRRRHRARRRRRPARHLPRGLAGVGRASGLQAAHRRGRGPRTRS